MFNSEEKKRLLLVYHSVVMWHQRENFGFTELWNGSSTISDKRWTFYLCARYDYRRWSLLFICDIYINVPFFYYWSLFLVGAFCEFRIRVLSLYTDTSIGVYYIQFLPRDLTIWRLDLFICVRAALRTFARISLLFSAHTLFLTSAADTERISLNEGTLRFTDYTE